MNFEIKKQGIFTVVNERDNTIAENQKIITENKKMLSEKAAELLRLQKELTNFKANHNTITKNIDNIFLIYKYLTMLRIRDAIAHILLILNLAIIFAALPPSKNQALLSYPVLP